MPGGSGTMQELLALLIFRSQKDPLMEGKPIVIYNRRLPDGTGFWDSLVDLLHAHGTGDHCIVTHRVEEIVPALIPLLEPAHA
jgi:predicted Rossmann-fold nucleotide-binding protein